MYNICWLPRGVTTCSSELLIYIRRNIRNASVIWCPACPISCANANITCSDGQCWGDRFPQQPELSLRNTAIGFRGGQFGTRSAPNLTPRDLIRVGVLGTGSENKFGAEIRGGSSGRKFGRKSKAEIRGESSGRKFRAEARGGSLGRKFGVKSEAQAHPLT